VFAFCCGLRSLLLTIGPVWCVRAGCSQKDQVIAQLRRTVVEQGDNIKRLNEELAASRDGCTTSDDDEEEEEEEEELGGLAEEVGGSGGSAEEEEEEQEEVEGEEQLGLSAIEWYMLCMTYLPGMAPRRYEAASGVVQCVLDSVCAAVEAKAAP
jgi:hypothetical protein